MGKVNTKKMPNGYLDLEIIYGGDDSPFGGIDTSGPPMYIDPNSFQDSSNFLILEKQLVAVGWSSLGITLSGWPVAGMHFMDIGTYIWQENYYNFVIAYFVTPGRPAGGVLPYSDITYVIWVWSAGFTGAVPITAQCTLRQTGTALPAVAATATMQVIGATATAASTATTTIGGVSTGATVINIGDTPATVAANVAATINGTGGIGCTAAIDPKFTNQINLTWSTPGHAGNNVTISVFMGVGAGSGVPIPTVFQGFSGGTDSTVGNWSIPIFPTSYVQVGESLYFSGAGTCILQFQNQAGGNPPIFQPITQYLGAIRLGKYNNQLIAVGVVPGPGQNIQASEMVIAWCAPKNQFGVWNPLYSDGTVTGAGFNQITDISDYLSGIFISPGIALILRSQGLDYITPLSGGATPFDFQHISNALRGEGCQDGRLVTQYDQVGFFIGNSNVYQFTGSLGTIGDKIKNLIIAKSQIAAVGRDATSGVFVFSGNSNVLVFFLLDSIIYVYCPSNNTWIALPLNLAGGMDVDFFATSPGIGLYGNQFIQNYFPVLSTLDGVNGSPLLWQLKNQVQNIDFGRAVSTWVVFKQEEILFGRDITINALYINCAGVPGQVIGFTLSGQGGITLFGGLTLPGTASPSTFVNYPVYFNAANPNVTTLKNPQLRIDVALSATGTSNPLYIAKIGMYGSVNPEQSPV